MYDDDVILPSDPEAEANDAAAKEFVEQQQEVDAANDNLYQRSYEELINAGYTPEQAAAYYADPSVTSQVRQMLDQEAYQEFLKEYPNVKPEEVPVEAWESFQRNGNLVKSFEKNDKFLRGFASDMPVSKEKPDPDPFVRGFDSI